MARASPRFAPQFVATSSDEDIATQLREDAALIDAGNSCSWVAWHVLDYRTEKEAAIAAHLASCPGLTHAIKEIVYVNILRKITEHLKDRLADKKRDAAILEMKEAQELLLRSELLTALKVLAHLQETAVIQRETPAETITSFLEEQVAPKPPASQPLENKFFATLPMTSNIPRPPPIPRKRLCYICRLALTNPDPAQPSMCVPCAAFNISSSLLSTPAKLSLPSSFVALVTGAWVNLGYHTALRLLRCGARVIATTRYPRDTVSRYLGESDHAEWKGRLRVVGADFRSLHDAAILVHKTKSCLNAWADGEQVKLCALINNAAQTLTDSVKKEERAASREQALLHSMKRDISDRGQVHSQSKR